jgi:L-asparaginase
MKHILLIATGGTIASMPTETGLSPKITSEDLLSQVPEIRDICKVSAVQLFTLDSTNMRPENWLEIARYIRSQYFDYDGFVITHGTDTMAYASAMLYYLIQNSQKPIVLTGSQISISERDTDARDNLLQAFRLQRNLQPLKSCSSRSRSIRQAPYFLKSPMSCRQGSESF